MNFPTRPYLPSLFTSSVSINRWTSACGRNEMNKHSSPNDRHTPVELVMTPILKILKDKQRVKTYRYFVSQTDMVRAQAAALGPGPVLALMGIQAASKAAGGGWVTLRPQVRDAWGYSAEWWRVNTNKLYKTGFIEVERRAGAVPRYRLIENSVCPNDA